MRPQYMELCSSSVQFWHRSADIERKNGEWRKKTGEVGSLVVDYNSHIK